LVDAAITSLTIQFIFVAVTPPARLALLQVGDVVITIINLGARGKRVIEFAVIDEIQRDGKTSSSRRQSGQWNLEHHVTAGSADGLNIRERIGTGGAKAALWSFLLCEDR